MELLYTNFDDIHLYGRFLQGILSFSPRKHRTHPQFSRRRLSAFGTQMYHRLGSQGATSLLAGLACLMVPILFVLGRYGFQIRKRSPWASIHVEDGEDRKPSGEVNHIAGP